jgi:hypothetical protein
MKRTASGVSVPRLSLPSLPANASAEGWNAEEGDPGLVLPKQSLSAKRRTTMANTWTSSPRRSLVWGSRVEAMA